MGKTVLHDNRLLGAGLWESKLEDVFCYECNAERAMFSSAVFKATRFEKCNLREASFEGADLSGVVFADCDLTLASFQGAKLNGTDFRTAQIDSIRSDGKALSEAIIAPLQAIQLIGLLGVQIKELYE